MLPNLRFSHAPLEEAFLQHHQRSKRWIVRRFAYFRAGALLFLAWRGLTAGDRTVAILQLLTALASFVPLLATGPRPAGRAVQVAVMAVDILQAAVGCTSIQYIAPSRENASDLAAVCYLLHASGVMWPHFYSLFSPLPFHLLLLGQAAVCLVLLALSGFVCRQSLGLRRGYSLVRQAVLAVRHLPASFWAAEAPGTRRSHLPQPPAALPAVDVELCVQGQMALLLPGFAAAMWAVYRWERTLRLKFLASVRRQQQERQAPSSAAAPSSQAMQHSAPARLAACLGPLPADVVCLLNADLAPSSFDFLLNFAIPAVAAMWFYACLPLFEA